MDRGIYVVMSGAQSAYTAQTIHANNLANVPVTGYRGEKVQYEYVAAEGSQNDGARVYAKTPTSATNYAQGQVITTGRDLDVALQGEGWLTVLKEDGTEAYTRNGRFHLTPEGFLRDSNGNQLIGNGGPVTIPPAEKIEFGADGTISIRPIGQPANSLSVIDRLKLVEIPKDNVYRAEDGMFYTVNGEVPFPSTKTQLVPGALEASNVNAVDELMSLLMSVREYEIQVKAMKEYEEIDNTTQSLMAGG